MVPGTKAFAEAMGRKMARPWATVTVVRSRGLPVAGFGPLKDENVAQIGCDASRHGEGTWRKGGWNKCRVAALRTGPMTRCGTGGEEAVVVAMSWAGTRHQPGLAKEGAERSQSGGRSPA